MGTERTRHKDIVFVDRTNKEKYHTYPYTYSQSKFVGGKTTVDSENNWYAWRDVVKRAPWTSYYDKGSNFSSTSFSYRDNVPFVSVYMNTKPTEEFHGWAYPAITSADHNNSSDRSGWWRAPTWGDPQALDMYGSTAISRCSPVNPHAGIVQMLGELKRDGLPSVPGLQSAQKRSVSPNQLAGEYLNYEFGLKPLASDIRSISQAIVNADKILQQYLRDSGRHVRRRYSFPEETSVDPLVLVHSTWPLRGLRTRLQDGTQDLYRTEKTTVNRWFSGTFTYHADPRVVGRLSSYVAQAEHLLGANPDIADLYNLAPWSWLLDWFTNIGDVINNVKMFTSDGLIMRWGYIMEHSSKSVTYTNTSRPIQGTYSGVEQTFISERKLRRKATPFGFGLTEEEFTPRQWAILTALGMTQGSRQIAR